MELMYFVAGVLAFVFMWHFAIRRSFLDKTRDELFDLRDEVRDTYLTNGWDMSSSSYARMRGLINSHLHFTEEMTVFKLVFVSHGVEQSKELQELVEERSRLMFSDASAEQRAFIQSVRQRSVQAVMNYAVYGSFLLLLTGLAVTPIYICYKFIHLLNRGLLSFLRSTLLAILGMGHTLSFVSMAVTKLVARIVIKANVLEDYSFRTGYCA